MNKLSSIKIRYKDGTYSEEIPIGILVENIKYNDEKSLKQVLGNLDYDKGTVEERLNNLDTVVLKTSTLYWLASDSPIEKPDISDKRWSLNPPTWSSTTYIWQKTIYIYSDGTKEETEPVCLTGRHGESAINVVISSSAGDVFLRRDIQTILTCNVYYGTKDYSDHVTSYHWIKKDKDGNVDESWSRMPGKSISITGDDVNTKAIFDCEVTLVI